MTHNYKNTRSNEYATTSDFCRIYLEQMNNLYLLSLLLTANPQKAKQCFLSGFDDSASNHFVFKERAQSWARRSIILQAIRMLRPRPNGENRSHEARLLAPIEKAPTEVEAHPNLVGIVMLNSFERFVFIMSVLEMYSHQECSLLLGCFRGDVVDARTAALRNLTGFVAATGKQPISDLGLDSWFAEAGL